MQPQEHLAHLRADGERLLAVARLAPDAPTPSCPGWQARTIVGHVAASHEWVAKMVSERATERYERRSEDELPVDFDGLAIEYDASLAWLLEVLGSTDPSEPVWNWSADGQAPCSFWFRRIAFETVVHRVDTEEAAGVATRIDPALASDGIDDYLFMTASFLSRRPVDALHGTLSLRTSDTEGSWQVALAPDRLELISEQNALASISGPASDLYLWLLHRQSADQEALTFSGDESVLAGWSGVTF